MFEIDSQNSTADNRFRGGNKATGIQATYLSPDWLNMVQDELKNVLIAAGVEPNKADNGQLAESITSLISNAVGTLEPRLEAVESSAVLSGDLGNFDFDTNVADGYDYRASALSIPPRGNVQKYMLMLRGSLHKKTGLQNEFDYAYAIIREPDPNDTSKPNFNSGQIGAVYLRGHFHANNDFLADGMGIVNIPVGLDKIFIVFAETGVQGINVFDAEDSVNCDFSMIPHN